MEKLIGRIQEIEKLVHYFLEKYPDLRDDYLQLTTQVWYYQMVDSGLHLDSKLPLFFNQYCNGELTNEETIQRTRRKLQEKHPELRGKKWQERQHDENDVRQNIKKI
jgi:hypothetical protein